MLSFIKRALHRGHVMDISTLAGPAGLNVTAIASCQAPPSVLIDALGQTSDDQQTAALAICLGNAGAAQAIDALLPLLSRDGLPGAAAAWALGRYEAAERILALLADAPLSLRENAYLALAYRATTGQDAVVLNQALPALHAAEMQRVAQGRSGLGEQVCRILAILGSPAATELIERTIAEDPYSDKFELQRLAKAMAEHGRDQDSIAELQRPWPEIFADHLAAVEAPEAVDDQIPDAPMDDADTLAAEEDDPDAPEADDAQPPIDWAPFAASPQAAGLDPSMAGMATQFGPALDQLARQAVGVPLCDLQAQECAALLLQVVPQAVPPQAVQALLSPQGLNAMQALMQWLVAEHDASPELVTAIKTVRQTLREQVRSSGMLGGPDYSDPDET